MLFGDFEEDFAPKVAMGKDGIMTIISKYIHRLMVLKSEITLLERISSECIACMVKKSDFEVRNSFCYQPR